MSNSGFKYYLVILDDFTHCVWTFPLQRKSNVLATFVHTQFHSSITCLQTDNGKEFDNHVLRLFLATHNMVLRLS
jgi:transposase InsO family protein